MTSDQKAILISLLMDFKMGHTEMEAILHYVSMHWEEDE